MGKIVVSENVSLDGVIQDPAGVEGFSRGGLAGRIGSQGRDQAAKVALDEALGADAFLLGRRSYEFLAARWPTRTGPLADRLNSLPKYVLSSTLDAPAWNNTTLLTGDPVGEVTKLKRETDELRLMVYPVVLGAGERLFAESTNQQLMRLVSARMVDDLAQLVYDFVRNSD